MYTFAVVGYSVKKIWSFNHKYMSRSSNIGVWRKVGEVKTHGPSKSREVSLLRDDSESSDDDLYHWGFRILSSSELHTLLYGPSPLLKFASEGGKPEQPNWPITSRDWRKQISITPTKWMQVHSIQLSDHSSQTHCSVGTTLKTTKHCPSPFCMHFLSGDLAWSEHCVIITMSDVDICIYDLCQSGLWSVHRGWSIDQPWWIYRDYLSQRNEIDLIVLQT